MDIVVSVNNFFVKMQKFFSWRMKLIPKKNFYILKVQNTFILKSENDGNISVDVTVQHGAIGWS